VQRTGLISRLGHWFRSAKKSGGQGDGSAKVSRPDAAHGSAGWAPKRESEAGAGQADQAQLSRDGLERAYSKIIELISSIRTHLELQDQRAAHMAPVVDKLAAGLASIPDAANVQVDLLKQVSRRLESDGERNARIEALLSRVPQLADSQRETMVSISRRLDSVADLCESETSALVGFQRTLATYCDLAAASIKALERIQSDNAAQNEKLSLALGLQARRMTVLAGIAAALAAAWAAIGAILILR